MEKKDPDKDKSAEKKEPEISTSLSIQLRKDPTKDTMSDPPFLYADQTLDALKDYRNRTLKESTFDKFMSNAELRDIKNDFTKESYIHQIRRYELVQDNHNKYMFRNDRANTNAYNDLLEEPLNEVLQSTKITVGYYEKWMQELNSSTANEDINKHIEFATRMLTELSLLNTHASILKQQAQEPILKKGITLPRTKIADWNNGKLHERQALEYNNINKETLKVPDEIKK